MEIIQSYHAGINRVQCGFLNKFNSMKPLFLFLIEPLDGRRYDSECVLENGSVFSLSVSQQDHLSTQRQALVLEVPHGYTGPVNKGDTVITHHNVFRKIYNQKGKETSSNHSVGNGTYVVEPSLIYMHKSNGSQWEAIRPYIFVSELPSDDRTLDSSSIKQLFGLVEFSSDPDIPVGKIISFQPESEYEFHIDGRKLYRMYERNVTLVIN